ncbi:hypothetical protein BGP_5070 [Beggiatoa sp. PS]|nr:hypothetical protein BGP_5070 [Beggiatoa sp. PS]
MVICLMKPIYRKIVTRLERYTIYRTNADALDMDFINALKIQFKHKEVEIAVCETAQVEEVEEDETAFASITS